MRLGVWRGDQFAIDSRHDACADDLADAQGRPTGHGAGHLQGDFYRLRLLHTAGDVHGQAVGGHHVPAHAGQQHHVRFGAQLLGKAVHVDFGGDVQVVGAIGDTGPHQRSGGLGERPSEIEQDVDLVQLGSLRREYAVRRVQLSCQGRQALGVAAGQHQVESKCFRVVRRHASGVAGGAVDHQGFHGVCCQFL